MHIDPCSGVAVRTPVFVTVSVSSQHSLQIRELKVDFNSDVRVGDQNRRCSTGNRGRSRNRDPLDRRGATRLNPIDALRSE